MKRLTLFSIVSLALTPLYAEPYWDRGRGDSFQTGNVIHFQDGTTAVKTRDLTFYSDGKVSRQVGNLLVNNDGTSSVRFGNIIQHSDGEFSIKTGDTLIHSDGSTEYTFPNTPQFKKTTIQNFKAALKESKVPKSKQDFILDQYKEQQLESSLLSH